MHPRVKGSFRRLTEHEKVRFAAVGVVNTCVDFAVLFLLVNTFKFAPVIANIISTTVALIVSYGLNKRSVFGDTAAHNTKQVGSFIVVTLSGLWILQTLVIYIAGGWLQSFLTKNTALFIAKIIATLFSLTWNYLWYSRVVFKRRQQ